MDGRRIVGGNTTILDRADIDGGGTGLYLLVAPGKRVTFDALSAAIDDNPLLSITSAASDAAITDTGIELVIDGLTFDLFGLSDAPHVEQASWAHTVAFDGMPASSGFEMLVLKPGPHLAGGHALLPVVRGWMQCAQILAEALPDCSALVWPPASLAVGADFFCAGIRRWVERGTFPTASLVAFDTSLDGALQSKGLSYLTGQEMRLEQPLPEVLVDAERVALALAGHLALSGRIDAVQEVTAPDGRPLRLAPSTNGRFVRVTAG